MEFIILSLLAAALLAFFVPSIRASAVRKAAGNTDEVEFSTWRDWNGDGTKFDLNDVFSFPLSNEPDVTEPSEPSEPPQGVIRIQARALPETDHEALWAGYDEERRRNG